jgi:hypothetical protein
LFCLSEKECFIEEGWFICKKNGLWREKNDDLDADNALCRNDVC